MNLTDERYLFQWLKPTYDPLQSIMQWARMTAYHEGADIRKWR